MDEDDDQSDEERSELLRGTLVKALAILVVIGVVIALGTTIVVRALGLNESDSASPVGPASSGPGPSTPLPTTALPVPGESETPQPSDQPKPHAAGQGDIQLQVTPTRARPMERVNLTGTYKGADNVGLQVQRFENGTWHDFGVETTVRVGTYETYVQTGKTGEQRFRMYDPQAKKGSNVELVTIG